MKNKVIKKEKRPKKIKEWTIVKNKTALTKEEIERLRNSDLMIIIKNSDN